MILGFIDTDNLTIENRVMADWAGRSAQVSRIEATRAGLGKPIVMNE